MPTELQELQLRVALVDEASMGIAKLREELKSLSEGGGKKALDKFKQEQGEWGKQIKEISEVVGRGGEGLTSYIGKFGAAGLAFGGFAAALGVGLYSLKEFADKMVDLANKSKVIGMDPATMQNIIEQYERVGVSAGQTQQNMAGFSEALAEVNRIGSQRRMDMIQSAGSWGELMNQGIAKIQAQTSMEDKLNEVLTQAQNVYDNRLKETHGNVVDATKSENDFLKLWNLDPSIKILRNLDKVTEERKKQIEARVKATADYKRTVTELGQEWDEFLDGIKTSALSADGAIVKGLHMALDLVKEMHRLWDEWHPMEQITKAGDPNRVRPGREGRARKPGETLPQPAPIDPNAPHPPISQLLSEPAGEGGEGTFSKPGFSKGWEWMRKSENIEDRRQFDTSLGQGDEYVKAIKANTVEVKKMNENFKLLDDGQVQLKGLGGLPGFREGGGGGGGGGGGYGGGGSTGAWGGGPYGSSVGAGTGTGAGDSHPGTGKGGGHASLGNQPTSTGEGPEVTGPGLKGTSAGGVIRGYERRKGEVGEFNYAETGAFGKPGTNQTQITLKNGKTLTVNKAGAEKFRALFNDMLDRGYKINDIAGLSVRQKRGGGGLSEHSWGTAVDVNPGRNAFRGRTTDMPEDVEEMAWKRGISWGGRFGDPMHFEVMSPEAAAHKMKILEDRGLIDKSGGDKDVRTVKVETGGKLTAEVNAPKGTDVKVEGSGAFDKTETNRTMPLDK